MQLYFIDREAYGRKAVPPELQNGDYYLINEGGYGQKGAEGAADIVRYTTENFTHCCCAVGTGTMMAGLINASKPPREIIGISVLKNNHKSDSYRMEKNVLALLINKPSSWQIVHDYHFGGYAKSNPALILFMNEFYSKTHIPLDFVYTAKLFFGISGLIKGNYFPAGSKVLIIHSGGLQGDNSLPKGTLIY